MKNFPLELVDAVAGEVVSTNDLLNLRTVNKTLHALLTPKAFRSIRITSNDSFLGKARALERLQDCEELAQLVEEVVLDDQIDPIFVLQWPKDEDQLAAQSRRELADALAFTFSHLHRFPATKSIHLKFWPTSKNNSSTEVVHEHPMGFLGRQSAIIYSILSQPAMRGITSLTLTNLAILHFQGYMNLSTASFCSLRHLAISMLSNDEHATLARLPPSTILSFLVSPATLFPPTGSTALRSLTLGSERGKFYVPDMQLSGLFYPHLESLSLKNVVLHHSSLSTHWTDFILRHRSSLRKLELCSCSIFSGNSLDITITWSDIWNGFAALDNLVVFAVQREEDEGQGPGYISFDPTAGYIPSMTMNNLQVETDRSILEGLQAAVKARRATEGTWR